MPGSTAFVLLTAVALTAGGIYIYNSRQSEQSQLQPVNESGGIVDIRGGQKWTDTRTDTEHFYSSFDEMWNAINLYEQKSGIKLGKASK